MGWREPKQISRVMNLLKRKGIEYINGRVLKIDPANRLVKTDVKEIAYNYLIVALGADLTLEGSSRHSLYGTNITQNENLTTSVK